MKPSHSNCASHQVDWVSLTSLDGADNISPILQIKSKIWLCIQSRVFLVDMMQG